MFSKNLPVSSRAGGLALKGEDLQALQSISMDFWFCRRIGKGRLDRYVLGIALLLEFGEEIFLL